MLWPGILGAQTEPLSFSPDLKGFLTAWLVRGPFPCPQPKDRAIDYLRAEGGEFQPLTLKRFRTMTLEPFPTEDASQWRAYVSSSYEVDFLRLFRPTRRVLAYAATWVKSDRPRRVWFKLGSDDGVKVWLNGKLLHDNPIYRGMRPDEDTFEGRLQKGLNFLLVKVDQGGGDWRFCLRLVDAAGEPIRDIQLVLPLRMSVEEIQNLWARSIRATAMLRQRNSVKGYSFFLRGWTPVVVKGSPIVVKVDVVDNEDRAIRALFKEMYSGDKPLDKRIDWRPRKLAAGMYFLRMLIIDPATGTEIYSQRTPVFWYE